MSLADDLTKLEELRRTGALSEKEFAQAKAQLLGGPAPAGEAVADALAEQLAETRYQNELNRIDREWQIEREKYMAADRYGRRHVPTVGTGRATSIIGGVFGTFWTIMAFTITSGAPDFAPFSLAKVFFPLFGIAFTIGSIGYGIHLTGKAEAYNSAFAAYQRRRAAVNRADFR
jgi:hypothetical protein